VVDRSEQRPNPCPDWIDVPTWDNITELDKLPGLMGLASSFEQNPKDWKKWFMSSKVRTSLTLFLVVANVIITSLLLHLFLDQSLHDHLKASSHPRLASWSPRWISPGVVAISFSDAFPPKSPLLSVSPRWSLCLATGATSFPSCSRCASCAACAPTASSSPPTDSSPATSAMITQVRQGCGVHPPYFCRLAPCCRRTALFDMQSPSLWLRPSRQLMTLHLRPLDFSVCHDLMMADPPAFDLRGIYKSSSAKTPLIFVLSPGVDPTAQVGKIAH
jgi:hypothetical protein